MNHTRYFEHMKSRPDRAVIKDEWILKAINEPVKTELQKDGRIRKWAKVEGRYLRVLLLDDGITVHNAFFDRNFKE